MNKRWDFKPISDPECITHLSEAINVNPSIATMLIQRNIKTFDEAKSFFRPSLSELHDPFLMKDMDLAVERLEKAIQKGEKILVYGDYDVDGTTSVSLVFSYIRQFHDAIEYYIPDRYKEGYGISYKGIDYACENNFSLIISLDCGIKSTDHIRYANERAIDFIICDHHTPGAELPEAVAVLDPKRKDCRYPYKELSGCGVGFKLMEGFSRKNNIPSSRLLPYLDLVAISICSDIVPITGENRILTYYGLQQINKAPRPGIKALIGVSGFKKDLDVTNVVFGLGPRINAAGRIAHAKAAVQLLISENHQEADQFAKNIDDKNLTRKDFDSSITEEAIQMIEEDEELLQSRSTVLFKKDWHKGVIGIVASRCIEKYYRPTIILTESNNYATGSARSVDGFDLYEAISRCSDLLEQFGGHMYAAGLTLKVDNVPAFVRKFEEVVRELITEDQLVPQIQVDLKLNLDQINYKFYNILKQLAPFGPHNMEPVFVSENVRDTGNIRLLKDIHLKMVLKQGDSTPIDAIAFGFGQHFERIKSGKPFHICYSISENEFNGKKSLQLFIKDIKFDE